MKIVGKVSLKTLRAATGDASVPIGSVVPNWEMFEVADILLHRDPRVAHGRYSVISHFQRLRGHKLDDASWSHVSMYVGGGFIVESMPSSGCFHSGVSANYLHKRARGQEIAILRTSLGEELRFQIANYLLVSLLRSKRPPYGFGRLLRGTTNVKFRLLRNGIICSELVLEALAIGGTILVNECVDSFSDDKLFLPAAFASDKRFTHIEPEYFEIY
jgi:hypothetical protein